jgi:hypothetical protein
MGMLIGELAQLAGVKAQTIRYYESLERLTATFGTTKVEIRTNQPIQINPQHPLDRQGAVAEAYVDGKQVEADGKPIEHAAMSEDDAEALMIAAMAKMFGARVS